MTGHSGTYLLAPSSPLSRLLLVLPCPAPQHLRYPYWGLHRSPNVHHKRIRRPSTFLITASGTRFAASFVAPLIPAECNANASAGISFAPLHTFLQRFTFLPAPAIPSLTHRVACPLSHTLQPSVRRQVINGAFLVNSPSLFMPKKSPTDPLPPFLSYIPSPVLVLTRITRFLP